MNVDFVATPRTGLGTAAGPKVRVVVARENAKLPGYGGKGIPALNLGKYLLFSRYGFIREVRLKYKVSECSNIQLGVFVLVK